jgi:hypothetical protein
MITLLLAACAPDYENADVKIVGIGYNPEEIGPPSEPAGGILEYSWVNFAGAALNLGVMGFSSYDPIGPENAGYHAPYAAVNAFGYIFSHKLPGAQDLGLTAPPPEVDDACYTAFSPSGPLGSFETVDVGSRIDITNDEGTHGVTLSRIPGDYPANSQDAYTFYNGFDLWRTEPVVAKVPGDNNKPSSMTDVIHLKASFPFGETLNVSWPGGFAPDGAPMASMPQPLASVGEAKVTLPQEIGGVMMEWNGPRYDSWGTAAADAPQSTCLQFRSDESLQPSSASDCDGKDVTTESGYSGQMYTGPWDTTDGQVAFRWTPGSNPDEVVSLNVRFLGPIDQTDEGFFEEVIEVDPDAKAKGSWNALASQGSVPADSECPTGRRSPTACEDGASWLLDDSIYAYDGELAPWMRGDPNNKVVEVTCRLKDDGEFVLTNEMLADAITYARAHSAAGSIFYFARGLETDMTVPDAADSYKQRHSITPVKVATRAVDVGRFWYEE